MLWITAANAALLVDLYELTMVQAYWRERLEARAVFSLFFRTLPQNRNFMLACGLDPALAYLETLRFEDDAIAQLAALGLFEPAFLDWLRRFRFRGDVRALPEGTPVFPNEPILEIEAPIAEAQLVETFIMNQIHVATVLASKAARVTLAAGGRAVVDFGLRRAHGTDAGMHEARASYIAGFAATSNVLAGRAFGIPVTGTMAHSYVQAHDDEEEAFRAFADVYPGTTLLVDTYDTPAGVARAIAVAKAMPVERRIRAIRIDSGDLDALSRQARRRLDAEGLSDIRIFASGGLDERDIERLTAGGAPIDAFGVGTSLATSEDAPALDLAYKLVSFAGTGRTKRSPGKATLPHAKQVYRVEHNGVCTHDVLASAGEAGIEGRPLLVPVMQGGVRTDAGRASLEQARRRARDEIARLPAALRALGPAEKPYEVRLSPVLAALRADE